MSHPLLDVEHIEQSPDAYLRAVGTVFAVFDERSQDSGNISYGVQIGAERYFIKTAGRPDDPAPAVRLPERVAMLRNAARLWRDCRHPALPRLHQVIESPAGPLLVYQWVDGELVRADRASRDDPRSVFQRFRALPVAETAASLDRVFALHDALARLGWIAVDFYAGSLIYDFGRRQIHVMDLDLYRDAPFTNEMGRMFGSSRFMAPEEFVRGARIDERTNVFTMGRTAAVLLSDGSLERLPFRGGDALYAVMRRACQEDRSRRFDSLSAFYTAWRTARDAEEGKS
jgi:serine/threonine protein kinase